MSSNKLVATALGAVVAVVMWTGCATGPGVDDVYPLSQVEVLSVVPSYDGTVTITYRTLTESMWHCPGAMVVEDDDDLYVYFARSGLNDPLVTDVSARLDRETGTASVEIPGALKKRVFLDDGTSTRKIWHIQPAR